MSLRVSNVLLSMTREVFPFELSGDNGCAKLDRRSEEKLIRYVRKFHEIPGRVCSGKTYLLLPLLCKGTLSTLCKGPALHSGRTEHFLIDSHIVLRTSSVLTRVAIHAEECLVNGARWWLRPNKREHGPRPFVCHLHVMAPIFRVR